jgi:hypothetical protein
MPCHRKAAEQLGYMCTLDGTHVPNQYSAVHAWKARKVLRTRRVRNLVVQITPLGEDALRFALMMRERLFVEVGRLPLEPASLPTIGKVDTPYVSVDIRRVAEPDTPLTAEAEPMPYSAFVRWFRAEVTSTDKVTTPSVRVVHIMWEAPESQPRMRATHVATCVVCLFVCEGTGCRGCMFGEYVCVLMRGW